MYKVNKHTIEPEFVDDGNGGIVMESVNVRFASEIPTTTPQGIERENIVVGIESNHTVPVWTIDADGAEIGPRKKPNP